MPLDTQPLSPGRRALMLVVLLAFLGGSLGFAQWLVVRKHVNPVLTLDLGRYGFNGRVLDEYSDEIQGRSGVVDGHPRRVDLFAFEISGTGDGIQDNEAASEGAKELFTDIMGNPPDDLKLADLAGKKGVEAAGESEDGRFAWVRFAISGGRAAAICYSGVGKFTDADRKVFDEICASGVKFGDSVR